MRQVADVNDVGIDLFYIFAECVVDFRVQIFVIEGGGCRFVIVDLTNMYALFKGVKELVQGDVFILNAMEYENVVCFRQFTSKIVCINLGTSHVVWRVAVDNE